MLKYINLAAISVSIFIFAKKMRAISKYYQGNTEIRGSVLLTSRYGNFKIVPISEEDNLTTRICRGLQQVKLMKDGKLPRRTIEDLLDEL